MEHLVLPRDVMRARGIAIDPTAQSRVLTTGQKIVADYESDLIAEPCDLAAAIDDALERRCYTR